MTVERINEHTVIDSEGDVLVYDELAYGEIDENEAIIESANLDAMIAEQEARDAREAAQQARVDAYDKKLDDIMDKRGLSSSDARRLLALDGIEDPEIAIQAEKERLRGVTYHLAAEAWRTAQLEDEIAQIEKAILDPIERQKAVNELVARKKAQFEIRRRQA